MRIAVLVLAAALLTPGGAYAQRLSTGVVPVHYDITVTPHLAEATFSGRVVITLRLAAPASAITVNAAEIKFGEVTASAGGQQQRGAVTLDAAKEQASFRFPKPLPAGGAELAITYDGILNDDLRGLYLSQANNRRYAVTQLEATDARRMFPSFDEPAFKATFALTAIIDRGDHAISNGAVISDTPGPGPAQHTVKFETTPKMSTYLVALTVGDFVCSSGAADGIPIRICSTPDKKGLTAFALESTQRIVEYYNRYYSIKYPFKKLDIVAVPDFAAGAMENTAAIFYRETLLLAAPDASVGVRKNIAYVLAHEIAHQWFGDLVTMQWWDDIWLNEGFANWMMSKPVKAWRPDWQVELDEVYENHGAMAIDGLRSTRRIRATASTPAEISELFDAIAYQKGAAVLRMLEQWLGADAFQKGINAYIGKFQYGNARAEDFWGTLTSVTGKPVDKVMASFVDQAGLPLVSIEVECRQGRSRAVLSQERYISDGSAASAPGPLWQIPVCLQTSGGETRCEVLRQKRQEIRLDGCPAWVMANEGARGYYRAAAPPAMVQTMAEKIEALSPPERMAVLGDEWALVRAGRHDVGTVLDLAASFSGERTPMVMQVVAMGLAAVAAYTTPDTRDAYQRWVGRFIAPAVAEVGFSPVPGEDDGRRALRATVLRLAGGTAEDEKVLAGARELVGRELDQPGTVDTTLLGVLVELAAMKGDAALYERYLATARASSDPSVVYRYLNALTTFSDRALVRRTMDLVLSPDVRSQDAKLLIARMLGNGASQQLAWQLTRERWTDIQKKTGEFVGNTVIVSAFASFCDAAAAAEIRRFFDAHPVPDAERTLQQSLERINACAKEKAAQSPRLAQWLAAPGR